MSYTNAELVRHHIAVERPILETITDQLVQLNGTDSISFFGGPIEADSLKVKSPRSLQPLRTALTLSGNESVFAAGPIVQGSVVVASDSSQTIIYTENLDFIMDYSNGSLRIKPDGALVVGQSVVVWYRPYALYLADGDYSLDAQRGTLRRLSAGDIADGESVVIDYTPLTGGVTDDIINDAVIAANGLIEAQVDTNNQFTSDPALTSSATFHALEFVCRAAATRELGSGKRDEKAALAWMKLAADYAARAEQLLSAFRPPLAGPNAPVHS